MAGAPLMLTAAMIATATGGTVAAGDPYAVVNGFSIDSRTLQPGDVFFAIVAERDGHAFVEAAIEKGAAGAVVHSMEGPPLRPAGPFIIQVADTTTALQDLGRFVRREAGARVVAITGSAGKTTTKDTIAEFLSGKYRVAKNKGNLNNHLGLPLSLLELRHGADIAVMELGMNHTGEIRLLVNIALPDIRVWTNVGDAHLGHFESREAIADAKSEILENARPGDVLICNADDPLVMARVGPFAGRRTTFGLAADADVRGEALQDLGLDGTRLNVRTRQGVVEVHTPLLGRGNASNLLAAVAVATHFGIPLNEIADRASRLRPAAHRGAVLRLPTGVVVVDDSYNSSPTALQRALEVVAHETRATRKAAVLGEMLELGEHSLQLHRACGEAAAAAGLDRLIAVGGAAAQALAEAAVRTGMPADAVTWTASSGAAADLIVSWLASGDLVLVKGSRGINTDAVVDHITEEFS
ncbi:MAG TPA: UDP-N-acetylmuramoyl-tripeptide--D-alanyl-D-alanine ligase [Vicinamibacterales bacterium]|nr:UDP-N-acetylmuramoyl-tripeptide--D-alanyl-D-alanine ligase [Vicinamibacterales bacterium]